MLTVVRIGVQGIDSMTASCEISIQLAAATALFDRPQVQVAAGRPRRYLRHLQDPYARHVAGGLKGGQVQGDVSCAVLLIPT